MSLARSSIIVGVFTGLGMLLSFLANVVTASVFGATQSMDTYLAATTLPSYVVTIMTGALSITFIPVFAEYKNSDQARAWITVSTFINFLFVVTSILTALGIVFAPLIMNALAPGFSSGQQENAAFMLQLFFPTVIFSVTNELLASIYYSHHQYVIPLLNKVIAPSITIAYIVLVGRQLDVLSLVFAGLTGAVVQCGILGIGVIRNKEFHFTLTTQLYNEGVKKVLKLMAPLVAGMLIYKIVPVFDRFLLSSLPEGSISYLNYASKLQQTLVQILSTSLSLPVFAVLAQIAAEKRLDILKETMSRVIRVLFFVAVPFSVLLVVFGEPVIRLLYERGTFSAIDTKAVFHCFAIYMISLPVVAIGGVVSQGLYVLEDTRSVAIVGLSETMLYIALCLSLIGTFEYLAIPISYGIYFTASVLVLGVIFRRKLGLGGGKSLVRACTSHAVLAGGVGAAALALNTLIRSSDLLAVVLFALMLLTFFALAKLLEIEEANLVGEKLHAMVRRA